MWILLAICAAVSFGTRGILYQWTSRKPLNTNLLVFGVYMSGTILSLLVIWQQQIAWQSTAWIGSLMGLFSFIGNIAMIRGFAVGKASLIALLTGLPSIVVVTFAFFVWDERLNAAQVAAFLLIIAGIVTIRYTKDLKAGNMKGFGWGLLALVVFGFHDISGKFSMKQDAPQMWSLFMLFVTASVLVAALGLFAKWRARERVVVVGKVGESTVEAASLHGSLPAADRPWSIPRTFATGLVIGLFNMSGTFFLMRAFDIGVTGLVTALASMNVVLIIAYAGVFLKERFALKEWIGMFATLTGVILLSVFQ